jgi:hypothetical protein
MIIKPNPGPTNLFDFNVADFVFSSFNFPSLQKYM